MQLINTIVYSPTYISRPHPPAAQPRADTSSSPCGLAPSNQFQGATSSTASCKAPDVRRVRIFPPVVFGSWLVIKISLDIVVHLW